MTRLGRVYQEQDQALAGSLKAALRPPCWRVWCCCWSFWAWSTRAPLAVLVPLVSIGALVFASLHLVKILALHTSWMPYGDITNEFVSVVFFGAGSNYCIFLLSRYREGLRAGLRRREALEVSLSQVGEAISSSAATGIAAMTLMGFALTDVPGHRPLPWPFR